MNGKISDVYFEMVRLNPIEVFQYGGIDSKKNFLQGGRERFRQVCQDIITFRNLKHAGSLFLGSSGYLPGQYALTSISFTPCGGNVILEDFEEKTRSGKWFGKKITCLNHKGMVMKTQHSMADIGNLMLHLILKQMVPGLDFCNYLNCGFEGASEVKIEIDKAAKQLGVVAFIRNAFIPSFGEGNLGFILISGMKTAQGCDGFDEWLKYLVLRKFSQMRDFLIFSKAAVFSNLLGPKE